MDDGGYNPRPPIPFDGKDTIGGYVYHTYTMELLPHELRYLIDSNVVRRFPDRLVPTNSPYYDRISKVYRNATYLFPAEFDLDFNGTDTLGTDSSLDQYGHPNSYTYVERHYFETHLGNPGMRPVTIGGVTYQAAHHLIDYIKIWDVPKDVIIPDFPK